MLEISIKYGNRLKSTLNEFKSHVDPQSAVELRERIGAIANEALSYLEDYISTNPISERDLKDIQRFSSDLEHCDQKIAQQIRTRLNAILGNEVDEATSKRVFQSVMRELPEDDDEIPDEFYQISFVVIQKEIENQIVETSAQAEVIEGRKFFKEVLDELNRLKDRLGSSPNFGAAEPRFDENESKQFFLGFPMRAVKDWLRYKLRKNDFPQTFWKALASLFDVTIANERSQYEEAHIRIQQFGMLLANKEKIVEIIKNRETDRFNEFGEITGMGWHPRENGFGVELEYINFLEKFLTEYYRDAKKKGDDALIEYFSAFTGRCFENRIRNLEEYADDNPLEGSEAQPVVRLILDIDTNQPAEKAFDVVLKALGIMLARSGEDLTPGLLLKHIKENGVFDKEFPREGVKAKPTFEEFKDFAIRNINADVIEPYSIHDFLQIEFEIFLAKGEERSKANFLQHLQKNGTYPDGFDIDSVEVREFINEHV